MRVRKDGHVDEDEYGEWVELGNLTLIVCFFH